MAPQPYPAHSESLNQWYVGLTVVPSVPTTVFNSTAKLLRLFVANTSASPVSITLTDLSTAAGGQPCQVFPAVVIPGNSADIVDLGGVMANNGVQWFASAANAIHAQLIGAN